jgi:formate hydrogenlyase subunit 4
MVQAALAILISIVLQVTTGRFRKEEFVELLWAAAYAQVVW